MIRDLDSPWLRATVDIGNYMSCGQEGLAGSRLAAQFAAYVHAKDFQKVPAGTAWGWTPQPCTIGEGTVDLKGCFAALAAAGYKGYVALEYEGPVAELTALPPSLAACRAALPI